MQKILPITTLFLILAIAVIAKEWPNEEIPPNMEVLSIGNVRYIVPEGMRFEKDDQGVLRLETRDAFMARTFHNVNNRLKALEENQEKIRSDIIELLKDVINKLQIGLQNQESNLKSLLETPK